MLKEHRKIVREGKRKNCYVMEVEHMHGDADVYTKQEEATKSKDMAMIWYLLSKLKFEGYRRKGYSTDDVLETICVNFETDNGLKKLYELLEWKEEEDDHIEYVMEELNEISGLVRSDATCDGFHYAKIESAELYYYDNDGIKYSVEFK